MTGQARVPLTNRAYYLPKKKKKSIENKRKKTTCIVCLYWELTFKDDREESHLLRIKWIDEYKFVRIENALLNLLAPVPTRQGIKNRLVINQAYFFPRSLIYHRQLNQQSRKRITSRSNINWQTLIFEFIFATVERLVFCFVLDTC